MKNKPIKEKRGNFAFRIKIGEYEVEMSGTREEVLKTVGTLPNLMTDVHKAFEGVKPKTVATLTVKTGEPSKKEAQPQQQYPKIMPTGDCDDALIRVLESDWGKWRPRTADEIKEALKSNKLEFSGRMLAGVLSGLVKKGMVRRWNTDTGYVYILAKESVTATGETG